MTQKLKHQESKEFRTSHWDFYDHGIIMIRLKPDASIELEDAVTEYNYIKERHEYLPMKLIIIPGDGSTASKEVRDYSNCTINIFFEFCQTLLIIRRDYNEKSTKEYNSLYRLHINLKSYYFIATLIFKKTWR